MKATIHRIGNSQGVILPKPLLAQIGSNTNELEMTVERDSIVLRKPEKPARADWAKAAKRLSAAGDDDLVWPAFENEADSTLTW